MKERQVLASCIKSRDAWSAIVDHVSQDDLSEQGRIIFDTISDYYGSDTEASYCDADILSDAVARQVSAEKHKSMFRDLVEELAIANSSPPNVVKDFLAHRREIAGQKLATALLSNNDESIQSALSDYTALQTADDLDNEDKTEVLKGASITHMVRKNFDPESLIQVYPESLNKRLDGGLKRGHHVVIFARPEMGKTMTVINMMAGFLRQNLTVLYVGNEDPVDDIIMRTVTRLSGMTKYEVLEDPDRADALARDAGYDNIIFASMAPGTIREITALVEEYKPDVLVLDQLRNLNMHQDHFVQKLEQAATAARNLAKKYNLVVVSVTQAGDSASGKSVLDLGDVDSSNTGIPAQADLMLGLGATERHMQRGEIVMSLPKNKVSGRHEFFTVITEPQLSKIRSLE